MGPLPPQAEDIEELLVDTLDDLTYSSHPPPELFGPALLARVPFGRVDDLCPVALKPPSVVLGALETFIGYIGPRGSRAHTDEPWIRAGSCGKEAFRQLLVGGRSSPKAEARYDPARVDGGEQAKALVPSQAVGPSDVSLSGQPSMPPTLAVPDGHRRAIESLVRVLSCLQKSG
jgi:hypothetical protein